MKKVIRSGVLVLAAFLAGECGLFAQSDTAVLFGLVKDPSGGSVTGARVVAHNQGTRVQRELETDAKGLFYFTLLPPGGYEITVETQGFKAYRNPVVQIQVAEVGRLDVDLQLGSTSEHVEVLNSVSSLNTESVAQGSVISQEKIHTLPLNGRQFLQLALLVPGTNSGGRSVQQNTIRQSQVGGISIAGNRTNNTGFTLDGATNIDPDYNSLNYSPAIDTIAEFQVQAAMVPADFAQSSINVVTKSGTNSFHG